MQTDELAAVPEKILVAGSRKIQSNYEEISKLARMIGAKIVRTTNWILLNGGASEESSEGNLSIDYLVCTGAEEELQQSRNQKPEERILTIHPKEPDKSLHCIGKVEITKRATEYLRRFDLVAQAEAIITIEGGVKGTKDIVELGMALQKPVLPIACTGGKSREAWYEYEEEILRMFRMEEKPPKEYEMLTTKGLDIPSELSELLITKISDILKPECFIAMPFAEEFNSVYVEAIKPALIRAGYNPVRADYIHRPGDIMDQMIQHIHNASIFVADITNLNANVMYEIGMADTLGKPLVLIWESDQMGEIKDKLPFDIGHRRIIKYKKGAWKELDDGIYKFAKKPTQMDGGKAIYDI
jgi:hypothetical protein